MLVTERDRLREELVELGEKYGRERSGLLPILQEIQRRHHYISPYCMQIVADLLGLHPVEVHSVVSFYSFLNERPQGQFVIRLCHTITCAMAGKDQVARQLENDLGIRFGETTPDNKFTLQWANCLGMCDQGPAHGIGLLASGSGTRVLIPTYPKTGTEADINLPPEICKTRT